MKVRRNPSEKGGECKVHGQIKHVIIFTRIIAHQSTMEIMNEAANEHGHRRMIVFSKNGGQNKGVYETKKSGMQCMRGEVISSSDHSIL
jgi:hypothetical protein